MANANDTLENTNSNSPPMSPLSTMVPPMKGSNNRSPFGVNLTQVVLVKIDKNNFLPWPNVILPIPWAQS